MAPEEKPNQKPEAPRPAKRRAKWWHKLLLIAFGLLLILAVEGVLRLSGFGGKPPLFSTVLVSLEGKGTFVSANPKAISLFFPRRTEEGEFMQGSMQRPKMRMPKPDNMKRIVFIGESTVEGFPMPRNLTAAAFLQKLLELSGDGQHGYEVINLGVTAVASFPIRKVGEEALREIDPDLLVVYGAHNEFYGASGMASFQFTGKSVSGMEFNYFMQQTAMLQAANALAKNFRGEPQRMDQQLIEQMAGDKMIEPGGPLHDDARESLRENWTRLAAAAHEASVPVIFCTVASNERGLQPLASWTGDLEEDELEDFEARLAIAGDIATSNSLESLNSLEELVAQAPKHAMAHHAYARALEMQGRNDEAAEEYALARDLDAMPWRAARDKNVVIRNLAEIEGAYISDVERTFYDDDTQIAPGWRYFNDHVHPDLLGQYLIAKTIFKTIEEKGLVSITGEKAKQIPSAMQIAQLMGVNVYERYRIINMMTALYAVYPMNSNNQHIYEMFRNRKIKMENDALPWERAALIRWTNGNAAASTTLPISPFMLSSAIQNKDWQRVSGLLVGAVENTEQLTPERCAAQFLVVVALGELGVPRERFLQARNSYLEELRMVSVLPGQPDALVNYLLGAYAMMEGKGEEAKKFLDLARETAAIEPEKTKAFLNELPPPGALPRVLEKTIQILQNS